MSYDPSREDTKATTPRRRPVRTILGTAPGDCKTSRSVTVLYRSLRTTNPYPDDCEYDLPLDTLYNRRR